MLILTYKLNQRPSESVSEKTDNNSSENTTEFESENTTEVESENATGVELKNLTYGNDPNNLLQLEQAPCFGEGRVYYRNFQDQIVSFTLDGSDQKTHGTIGNLSELSSVASQLNYYNGNVYYMITQYREDYTRYTEIRSMDLQNGEEMEVAASDGVDNGMLIIGDNLFYSCYDKATEKTTVTAVNLITKERNLIFEKSTTHAGAGTSAFSTDGKYLYMLIPNGVYEVYRMPLSSVYEAEPQSELLIKVSLTSTILTDDGFYTSLDYDLVFFAYADSGSEWEYETLMTDLPADGETNSEEGIIRNLIWYSEKWIFGDAMISRSQFNRNLYYSNSLDYRESVSVGELSFEQSAQNGTGLYLGADENTLYVILENENGVTFNKLAADGTYQ